MSTEKHPIDQLFKEKLGNHEQTPPFGLLSRINEGMILQRKVRRLRQFKMVTGIAAAVLLAFMAGWHLLVTPSPTPPVIASAAKQSTSPSPSHPIALSPAPTVIASAAKQSASPSPSPTVIASEAKQSVPQSNSRPFAHSPSRPAAASSVIASEAKQSPATLDSPSATQSDKQSPKKESTPDWMKNIPKTQQYYSDNKRGSSTERKTAPSTGLWRIKAEISETFTAMLSGTTTPGTDTKSLNTVGGGMVASYKVSDKITISSGIRFSGMKQGSHSTYSMAKTSGITYLQPVEKSGNLTRDVSLKLPETYSIVYSNGMATNAENTFVSDIAQSFQYLEIPIQATYKLIDKKLSVGITGGISSNFLIGNTASITENGIKLSTGNTDNIRNVLYSGSAGIEFGYDLGNKLMLTVEPRVKQFMHSVSSNDQLNIKPMQVGIFTGIAYSF